jgi:hypothetical protein
MNKILFGLVWFVLFYFGACMVAGAIAGTVAASKLPRNSHPQRVQEVTFVASASTVFELRLYLFSGALVIAGIGSGYGYLPGTRDASEPVLVHQSQLGPSHVENVEVPTGLTQTGNLHWRRPKKDEAVY